MRNKTKAMTGFIKASIIQKANFIPTLYTHLKNKATK